MSKGADSGACALALLRPYALAPLTGKSRMCMYLNKNYLLSYFIARLQGRKRATAHAC